MLHKISAFISLDNIENNLNVIRSKIKSETKIMAAVKGDAYGHGAPAVAKKLFSLGIKHYAVACLDEALEIRRSLPDCSILVLGFTHPSFASFLSQNNITQTVFGEDYAHALSQNCIKNSVTVLVHLAIDTGMGRIGFRTAREAIECAKLEGLKVEGAFSHFSRADMLDSESEEFTKAQFEKFVSIVSEMEEAGIKIPVKHCANSAAIFRFPQYHLDMVRAGIVLYGLTPNCEDTENYKGIKPVMRIKSPISHIKTVEKGDPIGYGGGFVADKTMRVATVACGYADGLHRKLSGADVLVCGKRAKIIGKICMDQMMIDVTDIPKAEFLSEVTILGKSGDDEITAEYLANKLGTINYQVVCDISKRVVRTYK